MSGSTGDCVQLQILKGLSAHLALTQGTIPLSSGGTLAVNLATSVFRGRTAFGSEDPMPCVSILEGRKPEDASETPVAMEDKLTRYEPWHLLVQGFIQDDPKNPTDNLYNFKALVEQQLSLIVALDSRGNVVNSAAFRLGGLVDDMILPPGIVRPAIATTGQVESFYLPIIVRYSINPANPFAIV
jgi:hypothetical protein